jgi:hypothetical protein
MRTRLLTLISASIVVGLATPAAAQAVPVTPGPGGHNVEASPHRQFSPPKKSVLFGLNDHWEGDIATDDKQISARSGIVGTFLAWSRTDMSVATEVRMVIQYANWAQSRGAIPMIDLHPAAGVSLRSITAGSQDSILANYAKALRKWNHPFLLRLFPEMNGAWQPYSPGSHGNTPAQFIAAWRHVYRLFHHYGATKVRFIWNPDRLFTTQKVSFKHLWPGGNYVDWVGVDIYDTTTTAGGGYPSARALTLPSVRAIRKFTKKPLMIPEIGVANFAKKPRWIANSLRGLASLGAKAVVWFNERGNPENWRLDSSSAALKSARQTLAGSSAVWPGHNGGTLRRDQVLISNGSW